MNGCKTVGLLLVFIALSSLTVTGNGALGAAEVNSTITISVPPTAEATTAINIEISVTPAPPAGLKSLVLTVVEPDDAKKTFNPTGLGGEYVFTYSVNQIGNYSFQCTFPGETVDGIYYKSAQSQIATLTTYGDAVPPVEADGGTWSQKQPMNQPRANLGVASVNGKIYAIGGYIENGTNILSNPTTGLVATNEEYDPATGNWTYKADMPSARSNFAIAACQNKIYCIGSAVTGYKLDDVYHLFQVPIWSGVNEAYDPASDTWETKAQMPVAALNAKAHVVNDKIYIVYQGATWMYNPANDSWSTKAPTPVPYDGYPSTYPSAVSGEKIYYFGNHAQVQIYDTATDTWSFGGRSPRLDPTGVVAATTGAFAPQRIYFLTLAQYGWVPYGHTDIGAGRRTTFIYNPQSDNWSAGKQIPEYRSNFGVAVVSDKLYVVGGAVVEKTVDGDKVIVCSTVEEYTPGYYGQNSADDNAAGTSEQDNPQTSNPDSGLWAVALATIVVLAVALSAVVYWHSKKQA